MEGAFAGCNLASASIPGNVATIGYNALACRGLTNIAVDPLNASYSSADGVLCDKNQTRLLVCPEGKDGGYAVPNTVTSIDQEAFANCSRLESLTIPSSVTNIGFSAFAGCSELGSVVIPDSVTILGDFAFEYCTGLTTATIGKGVSSVPRGVFGGCRSLTNVTTSEGIKSIQEGAFEACASLSDVIIPKGVTFIGDYAFASCTGLTNIVMPGSVTVVLNSAFQSCTNLVNVTISSGITQMIGETFYACANLRSVTIPGNVQAIWDTDFGACTNLLAMYFQGNAPTLHLDLDAAGWGMMVLSNNPSLTVCYLPGTSGWGPTFGGRPTAIWQPQIRANDAAFGVQTNQFGYSVHWSSGMTVVVEACTSLANPVWYPLQSNLLTGNSWYFSDPGWTNYPARYYRVGSP